MSAKLSTKCDMCGADFLATYDDDGDPMPLETCTRCGRVLCHRCLSGSGDCAGCREDEANDISKEALWPKEVQDDD